MDKRGQEQPCPHCDRVFKQADRLKQHIQKQHADAVTSDGNGGGDPAPAAAAAAAAPKVLAPQAVAAVAAAAAAAVKAPASGKPAAAGAAGASDAAAPAEGPKMMDVGSRAGAYDAKSPKLLLHEWSLREKQPRPRYRASATEGGLWRCKVLSPRAA